MTVQCLLPIIPATVAEITSRISATTLLASVVPGSAPAVGLLHAFFGHHAACQRGAMFSTSRPPSPRFLWPPRCLPAWSHVQHQPPAQSTLPLATTLLASVEPCSAPAVGPARASFGHHAACQRGAMFSTSRPPSPRFLWPPRCLPAWSHVQHQPPAQSHASFGHHAACQRGAMFSTSRRPSPSRRPATASSILNTAPRWRAAWWRSSRFRADIWSRTPLHAGKQRGGEAADLVQIAGLEHRSTLASSVVAKQPIWCR